MRDGVQKVASTAPTSSVIACVSVPKYTRLASVTSGIPSRTAT